MKKNKKKGFTIVELVIVIAVIAILAAVLIPTFSNVIKKANFSSDVQLCRNMNTALKIEGVEKNITDFYVAKEKLSEYEGSFAPKTNGCHFYWCSLDNMIYIVNDQNGFEVKFPETSTNVNASNSVDLSGDKLEQEGIEATIVCNSDDAKFDFNLSLNVTTGGYGEIEFAIVKDNEANTINDVKVPTTGWQTSGFFDFNEDAKYWFFARFAGDGLHKPSDVIKSDPGMFCFVAGTQISMADDTTKNIEDVSVGDKVLAYDVIKGETYETVVLKTFKSMSSSIATVTLVDGTEIECTPSHPILTNDGFKSVNPEYKDALKEFASKDLKVGDMVVTINGTFAVESIEIKEKVVPVYNFHVLSNDGKENCTYIADGVVAHNACAD